MEISWYIVSFLVMFTGYCISRCSAATGNCAKVSTCKCQYKDDDNSIIDLESIAKKNDFAFPYQDSQEIGSNYQYAYNPCYPVTDTTDCQNVAACQKDKTTDSHYSIGDASSADFKTDQSTVTLVYTSTDQHLSSKTVIVKLICDKSATTPSLVITSEAPTNTYNFELTSECCCPNGCADAPPDSGSGGLSVGSILCITFTVLVVVYLVAGIAFMALVKKSRGLEVIPNYSFWRSLPGLTKDGFTFTYSTIRRQTGGKQAAYEQM